MEISSLNSMLTVTERFRELADRVIAANNVQIRDAEPLERITSYLVAMVNDSGAIGATAMLVADDEVPLAIADDLIDELTLDIHSENVLFNGQIVRYAEKVYVPIYSKHLVVGYVRLRHENEKDINNLYLSLFEAYGKLISKELELANTVAELGFRNESVERKQRELESVISLKNNILSVTTHDLRNPIAAIQGYSELLEDTIKVGNTVDEDAELFMNNIKKSASAMGELVEQLNEVALLELNQLDIQSVRVDINWLVDEVMDIMQVQAKNKHIMLTFERSSKPVYVEVDLPKCKRILFNLIGNAIKYTHERGTVKVFVDSDTSLCKVHVKDSGIGINKDKIEAIFEPFRKLRNHGTSGEFSSGLGLFICNYMVRLFKGSIQVESEPGVGSTFSMLLPLAKNDF